MAPRKLPNASGEGSGEAVRGGPVYDPAMMYRKAAAGQATRTPVLEPGVASGLPFRATPPFSKAMRTEMSADQDAPTRVETSPGPPQPPVVIIGGGLAGLACALEIADGGGLPLVLEGSDRIGGRVRTDEVEGFLLDRGFQVLLEAYPEARRLLDYRSLQLQRFYPGARIRVEGAFHGVADPDREFLDALRSVTSPIGSLADKLRVARLRRELKRASPHEVLHGPSRSAGEELDRLGFSSRMVDRFFRPFFGGILLDRELDVPARLLRFYFQMFSLAPASVPARGMEEIPRQLAHRLGEQRIQTGVPVRRIRDGGVELESGEVVEASAVVVATEGPEATRLLGSRLPDPGSRGTTTLYFGLDAAPIREPMLLLNGETGDDGPVNHMAFMDRVSPHYAPEGRSLAAVNVLDAQLPPELLNDPGMDPAPKLLPPVRDQLVSWFGSEAASWRLIRGYRIPHAHPLQTPESFDPPERPSRVGPGVWVAGDHRDNASINGAMASGRRAAMEILGEGLS